MYEEAMTLSESRHAGLRYWGNRLFGGSMEEDLNGQIVELFRKAANAFISNKAYSKAAIAYNRAAKYEYNSHEKRRLYENALHAYKMANMPEDVIYMYEKLIKHLNSCADLYRLGDIYMAFGLFLKLHESRENIRKSRQMFHLAIDYFNVINQIQSSRKASAELAYAYTFEPYDYYTSIKFFEDAGHHESAHLVMPMYYFHALLVCLAIGDMVYTRRKMGEYSEKCRMTFGLKYSSFVSKLVDSIETGNVQDFENACFFYNELSNLTAWEVEMLTRAKTHLNDEVDLA